MTRTGFTDDGRSVAVSVSTQPSDSQESLIKQDAAAGALIDHALC